MRELIKTPTGIQGLDEITGGGLPAGRPTLVCGKAGCGKTLIAMEFIIRGVQIHDEPGVFISFEEQESDLAANVASLGWDLERLMAQGKVAVDHIHIEPSEMIETGDFDLDGLMLRIEAAVDMVDAKRIAIDTLEVLFGGFKDTDVLRAELRRLFRWLKERKLTAVITGEKAGEGLTRQGIEEFVSDCVIYLQHGTTGQIATRHLQIVKYRGSAHGSNLYPFLISNTGITLLPVTSASLDYGVSTDRVRTGIPGLDEMLGGDGFYRGSSVLLSGTAGTGKSTFAAKILHTACTRGERTLYFSFEESRAQILRNMASVGIELQPFCDTGLLRFHCSRASSFGLEMHLIRIAHAIESFDPQLVVFDPMSNLKDVAGVDEVKGMLTRVIDDLKSKGITSVMTHLSHADRLEITDNEISSLMDTWVLLRDIESGAERNRAVYMLKSRGIDHSNQIREYRLSGDGIDLVPVYDGHEGVLTGTARLAQEARDQTAAARDGREIQRLQEELEHRQAAHTARLAEVQAEFEAHKALLSREIDERQAAAERMDRERQVMRSVRSGTATEQRGGRV